MKINFDSGENLPLNKTIEIPIVTTVIKAVFHENIKYYTQAFLDECPYKQKVKMNFKKLLFKIVWVNILTI